MNCPVTELLSHYAVLESRYKVTDCTATIGNLVTASTNKQYPVQRWYHFKEAFSLELLETLIEKWQIPADGVNRVLDPFCGTGTSLLAVQRLNKKLGRSDITAVGMERNPFLEFVADTKVHWHKYDHRLLEHHANHLLNGAPKPVPNELPELSTFHREDIFPSDRLKEILAYKGAIDAVGDHERSLLLLGYASTLEDLSGARKDGRMVRIVKNKEPAVVSDALQAAWRSIADDVKSASAYFQPVECDVILGDGRKLLSDSGNKPTEDFDLVLYSPPYLNNIDYTEVYKIELWLCGFVNARQDFRALRYRTFRSHPSVKFPDPITLEQDSRLADVQLTLAKLIDALPDDEDKLWREQLFKGYFDDMYQSLDHQLRVTRKGGWIFCIVGNSLHGSDKQPTERVPVASDLIIASIAQAIGLEVMGIQVARYLRRRGPDGHLLRESVVALRKA